MAQDRHQDKQGENLMSSLQATCCAQPAETGQVPGQWDKQGKNLMSSLQATCCAQPAETGQVLGQRDKQGKT